MWWPSGSVLMRGEPWQQWRALRMLARYAPGLAPAPVHAALDAGPPWW
jgi:hypothetical protein